MIEQAKEDNTPVWDEYAHVYIMGINEKAKGQAPSEFENPRLQRIYNYGYGIGNPPNFEVPRV